MEDVLNLQIIFFATILCFLQNFSNKAKILDLYIPPPIHPRTLVRPATVPTEQRLNSQLLRIEKFCIEDRDFHSVAYIAYNLYAVYNLHVDFPGRVVRDGCPRVKVVHR